MLCYRCGNQVADGTEYCGACGQKSSPDAKPRASTGFGAGTRRHRIAVESSPYNVGDLLADRFEVIEQAGSGSTGWVYKCTDRDMDLDVAVKVISPRLLQTDAERRRLSAQMRRLRGLVHDNIVRVYEDGEDSGRLFFTMQYVDALPLRRIWDLRREKGQAFTLAEVNELVKQIASAVDDAHDNGLSHGTLKPDNVLVLPDLVKVSDFGLAEALPRASFIAAQKAGGISRYLAPELRLGEGITARADVFSLGVIVGEMLGGAPYEPGLENAALPDGVNDLVLRATAPKPEDRFASAGAFAQALANAVPRPASVATQAKPSAGAPRPPPPPAPIVELDEADDFDVDEVEEVTDAEAVAPVTVRPPPPRMQTPPVPVRATPPAPKPVAPKPVAPKPAESKPRVAAPVRASASLAAEPAWTARSEAKRPVVAPVAFRPEPKPSRSPVIVAGLLVALIAGVFFYLAWGAQRERFAESGVGDTAPVVVHEAVVDAGAQPEEALVEAEPEAEVAAEPVAVVEPAPVEPEPKAIPQPPAAKPDVPAVASQSKEERRAAQRAEILRLAEEREDKRRRDEAVARLEAADRKAEADRQTTAFEQAAKAVVSVKPKAAPEPEPAPEPVAAKEPTCAPGMRLIPAGSFRFGSPDSDDLKNFGDVDQSTVMTAGYCIDLYEYPNRKGSAPGTNVKFTQAVASCKSRGKRLCTEPEWERACKGPSNARFPYGNAFNASACNTEDATGQVRQVSDTGSFGQCASGYGVFDLAGNVAEWVDSPFDSGANRTVKGGAANRPDFATRCAARVGKSPDSKDVLIGFRCCADPT